LENKGTLFASLIAEKYGGFCTSPAECGNKATITSRNNRGGKKTFPDRQFFFLVLKACVQATWAF
jgi:hypothetical protein